MHPKNVCEKVYRQPPLRKAKLRKQDLNFTKPKTTLLHAADRIGKTIQYHCAGFMPNRRQVNYDGLFHKLSQPICHYSCVAVELVTRTVLVFIATSSQHSG